MNKIPVNDISVHTGIEQSCSKQFTAGEKGIHGLEFQHAASTCRQVQYVQGRRDLHPRWNNHTHDISS